MTEQTSIGANDGIIVTTVGATPSSGPFAIDFPFDNLDDVIVTTTDSLGVQTILTRGLHYSIAATVNGDGLYPSGTLSLVTPVANVALARWRSTPLERSSQLPLTGYLDRAALNSDLNRMMMAMQDFERRYGRYIRLPDDDPVVDAVVPAKGLRAGKTFIWDANGLPSAGELTTVNVVLNDFWRLTVLPTASAPAARTALGAAGLTSANAFSATNSFAALTTFTAGATFSSLSPTTIAPGAAADDSTKIPNTAWVQDAIDAKLGGSSALTTVPVIVELTSGSGTWTVPAGAKWFDVEMIGGGGGGGSNVPGANGNATTFDGVSVAGGAGGGGFNVGGGLPGSGGVGGTGGTGGTGTGTATTIIRRGGAHGDSGGPNHETVLAGQWCSVGGHGATGALGGAPGKGGTAGAGTAGAPNTGAGGGGYGEISGIANNGGAGGGGAGESALLRYATVAASYSWTVGAGATGAAGNSAGGSGYIRIRCHFNY